MGDDPDEPLGHLVVHSRDLTVPIFDQLFVGRECAGVGERRRLVLAERHISRNHFEIRLIADLDLAVVIDTSTNGTLLNGEPLARTVAQPIKTGDEITIADIAMTFRSRRFRSVSRQVPTVTQAQISESDMVMVVGDIIGYSTISEVTDSRMLAESLYTLWCELDGLLRAHHGTLSHYAGDALYAVWNVQTHPDAHRLAIDFALAADRLLATIGASLSLRDEHGAPIRMGWSVVHGSGAQAAMARSVAAILGDSTNLAFRLAGIAGRDGRAAVLVTGKVHDAVHDAYVWGPPEEVRVKGRRGEVTVFPVLARQRSLRCG
ncbi:family 3 adenylate cyclase [Mycolicibacterium chubuense NBB4]|uniref:Family 3 adenylate cyclase n=1 Tax=Mycolicibacterium chubuense (strain NBB4) TaxID=710421 RepID=I4BQG0_MYCCN|nr:adenylate/guanylate cyclase domain-containing protein [Mycolicibacterium chubuense]AFM19517.1 family 3 adenylate cyclase [Mycolicibacterium chubuense NBB4]